jgi:hypothetical protein
MAGYALGATLRRIHLVPVSGFMGFWLVFDPSEPPRGPQGLFQSAG